jgi:hypothetical protein
METRERERW